MSNKVEERYRRRGGAVNEAFELTYVSFLVIPRTLLMGMPTDGQDRFVVLLDEYDEACGKLVPDNELGINVTFKKDGKFCRIPDTYANYKHVKHEDVLSLERSNNN